MLAGGRSLASCLSLIPVDVLSFKHWCQSFQRSAQQEKLKANRPKCHVILFAYEFCKLEEILLCWWKGFVFWLIRVFHACGSSSIFPRGIIVKLWIISSGSSIWSNRHLSNFDNQRPPPQKKWKRNLCFSVYIKDNFLNVPEIWTGASQPTHVAYNDTS